MNALKSSAAAALLGLFVLATAHPALAVNRWVHNKTDHCVWFTIDTRSNLTPWRNSAAGFVPPGQTHLFDPNNKEYLKVRAEPRATAACDGARIADLEITESSSSSFSKPGPSETTITGGSGKPFSLRWGK